MRGILSTFLVYFRVLVVSYYIMLIPTTWVLLLAVISGTASFSLTRSNGYSRAESLQYAAYSSLAYCSKSCLESWSCKSGKDLPPLLNVSFVNSGVDLASCYVGYQPDQDKIVVVFRGSASYEDWVSDWNHREAPYPKCDNCGIVQDFFRDYTKMEKEIDNKVLALYSKHPKATILVTGHSLGGGLAMIAGMRLKEKLSSRRIVAHTFGATRVGNAQLSAYMVSKISEIYRVVHDRDIVAHQPMSYDGYSHAPTEIFFNEQMDSYVVCDDSGEDESCSDRYPKSEWRVEDNKFYFIDIDRPLC